MVSGDKMGLGAIVGQTNAEQMLKAVRNELQQWQSGQTMANEVLRQLGASARTRVAARVVTNKSRYGRAPRSPSRLMKTIEDPRFIDVHVTNRKGGEKMAGVTVAPTAFMERSRSRHYYKILLSGASFSVEGYFGLASLSKRPGSSAPGHKAPPGPYQRFMPNTKTAPRFFIARRNRGGLIQKSAPKGQRPEPRKMVPLIHTDLRLYEDFIADEARKAFSRERVWRTIKDVYAPFPDIQKQLRKNRIP